MKLFLSALFSLAVFAGIAQPKDAKTKAELDKLSAKLKTLKTVEAKFTLTQESGKKVTKPKTGTLYVQGNKYRLEQGDVVVISDGATTWNYNREENSVNISKVDPKNEGITPKLLFTNFYEKDFKSESPKAGQIVLEPLDKTKAFSKINLALNSADGLIKTATIEDKGGKKLVITVNDIKKNPTFKDVEFGFDTKKYPGIEVIK